MYILAEIIANVLLLFGLFIVRWGIRHKSITLAIGAVILMIIDVFVILRLTGRI